MHRLTTTATFSFIHKLEKCLKAQISDLLKLIFLVSGPANQYVFSSNGCFNPTAKRDPLHFGVIVYIICTSDINLLQTLKQSILTFLPCLKHKLCVRMHFVDKRLQMFLVDKRGGIRLELTLKLFSFN